MSEGTPRNYSPNQQKIIKRYYDNLDTISLQKLAELAGELYLAEGKKKEKAWKTVESALQKLEIPPARIAHILAQRDPALVADLVKELQRGK